MDWTDKRPIGELRFGAEWKPTLGDLVSARDTANLTPPGYGPGVVDPGVDGEWNRAHAEDLARMRRLIERCHCTFAEDIVNLGCTGAKARGLAIDEIKVLRIGLGGSGVGLPCYVPPNRFCYAHDVIGGLQDKQEQWYSEQVEAISRELTKEELAKIKLVEAAQRSQGEKGASDVLAGHALPEGWSAEDVLPGDHPSESPLMPDERTQRLSDYLVKLLGEALPKIKPWTCPEHKATDWRCRYCVAQAIVEGPLLPSYYVISPHPNADTERDEVTGDGLEAHIAECDAAGCQQVAVYARVATFTHKLARD